MKKIFARQLPVECFDAEIYMDEEMLVNDHIWLGGNRDFCELNKSMVSGLIDHMESFSSDLADAKEYAELSENPDSEEAKAAYLEDRARYADYYFDKASGEAFTEEELAQLEQLSNEYFECRHNEEKDILMKVLKILYGVDFTYGTLRGCCQGDWIDYVAPASTDTEYLDYIEAVYFGTGTEFSITADPIESADEFEDAPTYCDYTAYWRDEDIKKWIASQFNDKYEVVLLKITAEHVHHTYDYEEA